MSNRRAAERHARIRLCREPSVSAVRRPRHGAPTLSRARRGRGCYHVGRMETPPHALDGLRVLDQTQVMAGPFCAMLLADMGADVIKIEPPGGENTRGMDLELAPGVSAPFLAVNRNKRGIVLDLKQPGRRGVSKKLVATADVLVENYRPGVARRLGVDYATLRGDQPAPDLLLDLRLRPDRALRRPRRLRPHRPGHERDHERHGQRGRRAGQGRRPDHRPGRRASSASSASCARCARGT